jgi:quinol monooxygenase YgiN
MVIVLGEFRFPLENRDAAQAVMERVVQATRAEAGCITYSYAEDVLDPGLFRITEIWESREALAVHFEAPHMKDWQRERAELGLSGRAVTAYSVSSEETL